jgi:hypothetical protein
VAETSDPIAFAPVRRVAAGVLDVGYVEVGPRYGQAVVLLHGWPYDIHSYGVAARSLAAADYRVVVPYLRGYGPTRFLAEDTMRNGQQSALAVDAIALMDALGIRGDRGRLRLGRAHRERHGGALAPTLPRTGVGERLSDRQPVRTSADDRHTIPRKWALTSAYARRVS